MISSQLENYVMNQMTHDFYVLIKHLGSRLSDKELKQILNFLLGRVDCCTYVILFMDFMCRNRDEASVREFIAQAVTEPYAKVIIMGLGILKVDSSVTEEDWLGAISSFISFGNVENLESILNRLYGKGTDEQIGNLLGKAINTGNEAVISKIMDFTRDRCIQKEFLDKAYKLAIAKGKEQLALVILKRLQFSFSVH